MVSLESQVPGDSPNGRRPQQHRQMPEAHRRPRAVPHLSDFAWPKGQFLFLNLSLAVKQCEP